MFCHGNFSLAVVAPGAHSTARQLVIDVVAPDAQHGEHSRYGQERRRDEDSSVTKELADSADEQSTEDISGRVKRLIFAELSIEEFPAD